jgi:hypothetical protein
MRIAKTLVCLIAGAASACLDNKLEEPEVVGERTEFIAQTQDFAHYSDWMLFEHDVVTEHSGLVGKTNVYVSKLPNSTTHKFPIGTLLLKTTQLADSDKPTIHAMSKRGAGYNQDGTAGWEFFELLLSKTGQPYIFWRGAAPPDGEQYKMMLGGETMPSTDGDCNSCHGAGQDGVLGDDIVPLLMTP